MFELFETFDEGHAVIFADAVDYDDPVSCVTDEMGMYPVRHSRRDEDACNTAHYKLTPTDY